MRTVRTKVYKFSELSKEAKEKAIESYSDINVDGDWWDFVYEDFKELCDTIGVEVDLKKTYFNGFYSQGSGSSFTAWVDIKKCLESIKAEKWKEYAPNEDLKFYNVTDNMLRLCHLCSCNIEPTNRESSVKINFNDEVGESYPNIYAVIEEIESFLEDMAETLNGWLYSSLEKNYEYQTSEEAIIETIEANEYEFTREGKQYY